MARSRYIYIVVFSKENDTHVQAAFTVKKECKYWVDKNIPNHKRDDYVLLRLRDGHPDLQEEQFLSVFMEA